MSSFTARFLPPYGMNTIIQLIIERTWVEIALRTFRMPERCYGARNCFVRVRCARMFVQLLIGL